MICSIIALLLAAPMPSLFPSHQLTEGPRHWRKRDISYFKIPNIRIFTKLQVKHEYSQSSKLAYTIFLVEPEQWNPGIKLS